MLTFRKKSKVKAKVKRSLVLLFLLLLFCVGCNSVADKQYIQANNAWFDTNAPQYRSYLNLDSSFNADQKRAALNALDEITALNKQRAEGVK